MKTLRDCIKEADTTSIKEIRRLYNQTPQYIRAVTMGLKMQLSNTGYVITAQSKINQ